MSAKRTDALGVKPKTNQVLKGKFKKSDFLKVN
jgi:hypothetical protein